MRHNVIDLLAISFFLSMLAGTAFAQIGEVAGPLNFVVNVSGSETLQLTILNSGNQSLPYQLIPPAFQNIPNETNPVITMYPLNGTLPPYSSLHINVTAYIPSNDKPGTYWRGGIQVMQKPHSGVSAGGATIFSGVAKIVYVTAAYPKPWPLSYYAILAIIVLIIAALAYKFAIKNKGIKLSAGRRAVPLLPEVLKKPPRARSQKAEKERARGRKNAGSRKPTGKKAKRGKKPKRTKGKG